ncbi:uncharacterized protein LOC135468918 [Liolophura sinensis]|uniref:uncharacterized protein LOC135468918 n=1 Tax=Liolophura sinensis TaxID=3198878 RepID=UPI00315840F9
MATPGFQVYQDKENVSSVGNLPKARNRHGIAPVAKIFGASNGRNDLRTPVRRALGSVNREPHVATPTFLPTLKNDLGGEFRKPGLKSFGPTPIKRQPLASKPAEISHQNEQLVKNPKIKNSCVEVCKPKPKQKLLIREDVNQKSKQKKTEDDIETMFITKKGEDDFEDIWPKEDRPSSYLDALINWRPPCFGDWESEEQKDDEERRVSILQDMKAVNDLVFSLNPDTDDAEFEVPPLEFPSDIDNISFSDIAEHIGSLVLKED